MEGGLKMMGNEGDVVIGGEKEKMGFEETELRLGIGIGEADHQGQVVKKRGFSETETIDLKLNLSNSSSKENELLPADHVTDPAKPPAK